MSSLPSSADKPTELLGIIGGSNLLESSYFKHLEPFTISTTYGDIKLYRNKYFIFCQRHHSDSIQTYVPPHLINKNAIFTAFKLLNVSKILAFGSVGTLKPDTYLCGKLVIPDDWFNLHSIISTFKFHYDGHVYFISILF